MPLVIKRFFILIYALHLDKLITIAKRTGVNYAQFDHLTFLHMNQEATTGTADHIVNLDQHQEEYFELRVYTLKNQEQQKLVEDFYRAVIPVYNRRGVNAVGVFTSLSPSEEIKLYVLVPYHSIVHFAEVTDKLECDAIYQTVGAAYLNAAADAPAYERIESSLMKAFKCFPKLVAPEKKDRIFELRQYQSPTEAAGKKKIEMFNEQGEIEIFKRLAFNPVFWGETIIGPLRPNLTYMVTFDNLAAKDQLWASFIADDEWNKISVVPGYANELLLNLIVSTLLVPTAYSQI